jgi:hypothetical protein
MAHRDLGNFYRVTGELTAALKHFVKSREFCITNQQVLEQYFSCLEVRLILLLWHMAADPLVLIAADRATQLRAYWELCLQNRVNSGLVKPCAKGCSKRRWNGRPARCSGRYVWEEAWGSRT